MVRVMLTSEKCQSAVQFCFGFVFYPRNNYYRKYYLFRKGLHSTIFHYVFGLGNCQVLLRIPSTHASKKILN